MWKSVEMCFAVDVATSLGNQCVVAFTTSLQHDPKLEVLNLVGLSPSDS
jgi:hypothetical protein